MQPLRLATRSPGRRVVAAILDKHQAATAGRRFNAIFATASINQAIEYFALFREIQAQRQAENDNFHPLDIACVFSPPAEGNRDVRQLQEDLPQEKADNEQEPNQKKESLKAIIDDYNARFATNHDINTFDLYYQDVQKRIKDQQYPNPDLPQAEKIDIVIVVDMLLTGFDSKYLNTLYVDKNLKYHGLIQAFSLTNRVLNDTKPFGNVLDFRGQQDAVDFAIALFSGESRQQAKEIWLVDSAPEVIDKLEEAVTTLDKFMESQGLASAPEQVANLKGDEARSRFVTLFKEVQRQKTQLDQYTDLTPEEAGRIEQVIAEDQLLAFRGAYLDTARQLRTRQDKGGDDSDPVQQLDFEFVLFASAVIDYDYIMGLMARYSQKTPQKEKMTREQLIGLLSSTANMMDERDEMIAYLNTLETGEGLSEKAIRDGYETFKAKRFAGQLAQTSQKHGLEPKSLQGFVDGIMARMIFDGEQLSDLFAPQKLGWKERTGKGYC